MEMCLLYMCNKGEKRKVSVFSHLNRAPLELVLFDKGKTENIIVSLSMVILIDQGNIGGIW